MKKIVILMVLLFSTLSISEAKAQEKRGRFDVQLGVFNGVNYEYFLSKSISFTTSATIPIGFNAYFKNVNTANQKLVYNFYIEGVALSASINKYFNNTDAGFIKRGFWLSAKASNIVPRWQLPFNEEKENLSEYDRMYLAKDALRFSAIAGYTFRPYDSFYCNLGLGASYFIEFLNIPKSYGYENTNKKFTPYVDLSLGYIF